MKAVVIHGARDLRVEAAEPQPMAPGEIRLAVQAGGICGSDLHYYQHGGFGTIRVRQPLILGHEVAGEVIEVGADVTGWAVGDRAAISPSRPCGACKFCDKGVFNQCLNMRFYGSAMPMPHIQGAFRDTLVALPAQCHRIDDGVPTEMAAFAEPLAVVLHGLSRAGEIRGKRVLITGCGPIGALCLLAARHAGGAEVVVTDLIDGVLEIARTLGADRAINVAKDPDWTDAYATDKGHFDVMFEATGVAAAFHAGLTVLHPRATLVQLGLGGDITVPQNVIVAKEIEIRGAFRFHEEFADAVALINAGALNLAPLLTQRMPMEDAVAAFELAADRTRAMKVQLTFNG